MQSTVDCNSIKSFYDGLTSVHDPQTRGVTTLLLCDGTTCIKQKKKFYNVVLNTFYSVLNQPSSVDAAALQSIPQIPIQHHPDEEPTYAETTAAPKNFLVVKHQVQTHYPVRSISMAVNFFFK